MSDFYYQSKVLLPESLFSQAQNQDELERLVLEYIKKRYPDYHVQQIKDGMAICVKR